MVICASLSPAVLTLFFTFSQQHEQIFVDRPKAMYVLHANYEGAINVLLL